MIVTRSMHDSWRSNAFLVADREGGSAVFIDAGAPIEPLLARVDELGVRVTHVLLTHEHHDHTQHVLPLEERFGATLVLPERALEGGDVHSGSLVLRPLSTPGHCSPHIAWAAIEGDRVTAVFTGDALFRGTVGGTLNGGADGFELLRASVLDVLLALPEDTALYPGHMEDTSVGRELAENPFVRAWQSTSTVGGELGDERVLVAGNGATLLLLGPDYDGGTKAWVRFDDGREAIVGGSMLEREGARA